MGIGSERIHTDHKFYKVWRVAFIMTDFSSMAKKAVSAPAMSLLLIISGKEGYGIRRALSQLAIELLRREIPLTVVALDEGEMTDAMRHLGLAVAVAPRVPRPNIYSNPSRRMLSYLQRWIGQMRLVPWLAAQIQEVGATDVIVKSPPELLLTGLASRRARVNAFWMMPNTVSDQYPLDANRRIYDLIFRWLGVVPIANSEYTLSTLRPSDALRYVMHLGIDSEQFKPATDKDRDNLRKVLSISSEEIVLGVFARLVEYKGQAALIKAVSKLKDSDIHLIICGGPLNSSYSERLKLLVKEEGLGARVHMLGDVEDVRSLYGACDIVVSPHSKPEGFGLSVVEAMAVGRPVLATALGGPRETILDGKTGWLLNDPSPAGLAQGLHKVLRDRMIWTKMGQSAHVHAKEKYSSSAMVDRLITIIDDVRCRLS